MTKSNGISFTTALLIVFITLKLTGLINWSWVWVLSPVWIPFAFYVLIGLAGSIHFGSGGGKLIHFGSGGGKLRR